MSYQIRRPLTALEQNELGFVSGTLSGLLFHRGISEANAAERFIAPNYDRDIHDPLLLKDAGKAADRIIHAIEKGEKVAIYSDYDADGIPGAVMFSDFFKRIGFANFIVYIPHRHNEGFGVNIEAIDELADAGVKLVITIDCGISDFEPIARAVKRGMDVIVTDHHEPPPELPPAFAILDHKQLDCSYPDKNICGSGVAYKLVQAILAKNRFGLKEGHEKWLLDMVGIATLSDMVPLVGENRVFAHYGLAVLRKSPRKGLMRLLSKLGIAQRHMTEDDIAFMVTPRINAASRMGVPMDAFNMLAAESEDEARAHVDHLEVINTERKGVVASLVKEVKKTVRERHGERVPSVIVLGNPAWRPSLLGLAANSCAEEFDRPVFLWGRDGDNMIKGSCRSEGRTHVVELMRGVPAGVLIQYGGHKHSGGFAVSNDGVHFLEQHLNGAFSQLFPGFAGIDSGDLAVGVGANGGEVVMLDGELTLDAVEWALHNEINMLAPFGTGNPKPIFMFKSVVPETVRRFGKANDHVELVFRKSSGSKVPAISFFGAGEAWAKSTVAGKPVDLVASLEKSAFRGRVELRLRVVDVVA